MNNEKNRLGLVTKRNAYISQKNIKIGIDNHLNKVYF